MGGMTTDLPINLLQNDLLRLFRWHRLDPPAEVPPCELICGGSFAVRNGNAGYLTASLGAGVGLALYDRLSGVGGIAHFLLSEPSGGAQDLPPAGYVKTGLPIFLEALEAAGAKPDQLEAAVAGGCNLLRAGGDEAGPDRGSEMADDILEVLQNKRIPVSGVDVGGVRPISLLLDTGLWKSSIKLMEEPLSADGSLPSKPTITQLNQAISEVKPIPQIALKIIRLLGQDEDASFAELTAEIEREQVVAAKVLRYCNSAVFSPRKSIDSIEKALLLLGENQLLEIAVATAADFLYSGKDGGYALMRGGLYKHALASAFVAREIARQQGAIDLGVAYTAGLVHDIGKIVLDRFVAESQPFFYRNQHRVSDYIYLEAELFGVDHMAVGRRLAVQWLLPGTLMEVIGCHHRPERAAPEFRPLVCAVYLADLLADSYLAGLELEKIAIKELAPCLSALQLKREQLPLIIERVPWRSLMYL